MCSFKIAKIHNRFGNSISNALADTIDIVIMKYEHDMNNCKI